MTPEGRYCGWLTVSSVVYIAAGLWLIPQPRSQPRIMAWAAGSYALLLLGVTGWLVVRRAMRCQLPVPVGEAAELVGTEEAEEALSAAVSGPSPVRGLDGDTLDRLESAGALTVNREDETVRGTRHAGPMLELHHAVGKD